MLPHSAVAKASLHQAEAAGALAKAAAHEEAASVTTAAVREALDGRIKSLDSELAQLRAAHARAVSDLSSARAEVSRVKRGDLKAATAALKADKERARNEKERKERVKKATVADLVALKQDYKPIIADLAKYDFLDADGAIQGIVDTVTELEGMP